MKELKISCHKFTHKGDRENNEDFVNQQIGDNFGVWVVADGLGGHNAGEVASKMASSIILKEFSLNPVLSNENIEEIINKANQILIQEEVNNTDLAGMRTTFVGLFNVKDKFKYAHIGDSRLYYFKEGKIVQHTVDHSVSQIIASTGEISFEDIRFHEDRNKLLRVLGGIKELSIDISDELRISKGDAFLLCSDGFWEYVHEMEMEIDLSKSDSPKKWIEYMVDRIVEKLNGRNDNFTAYAVMIL